MSPRSQHEIRVLHVDDEPDFTELTEMFLGREDERFTIETATRASDGLELIDDRPPDCVVSDYNMPGMDGLEFLQAVREEYPDLPFILFTGRGSEAVASDAIAADVTDYLQKASGSEQYELLANRIRNAVQARREAMRADRQEQLMRLTEFAGNTGGFELEVETGEILLTDGVRRLIDLPDQADLSLDEALDLYHPTDRADIRQTIDHALETGERTHGTWQLQTRNGDERLVDVTFTPATTNSDSEVLRGAVHDITEQRERQRELRTERRFITQALDALDDLFYVIDTDGTLQRWNEKGPEVTGYSESDLDGMPAIELFPEDERKDVTRAIESTLTDGEGALEADLLTADGQRVPYEFKGARLTDENGNATGLVGVGRDLTERRQRERRFRALVEESKDIISIVDANGRYQYQSPSLERVLGYAPEETIGDAAWEYIHPDDRDRIRERFEAWVADPEQGREPAEYRARDADGSWRWMEANGNNQLNNPALEGYIVNSRDITARKEREQELAQTRDLMADMEQLAGAGAWEYDSNSETLMITDGARRLYGLDMDGKLTLEDALDAVHPDDRDRLAERFEECLETGESYEIDVRLTTVDGEQRWVTSRGEPVTEDSESGVIRGYIQDITEQRTRERRLERYRTVFNELPDPVIAYDEDDRYDLVNEAAAEVRNVPREELVGTPSPYLEQIREENPTEYEELVDGNRDTLTVELASEFSGTGERIFECRLFRLTAATESDEMAVVTRDITERRNRERELSRERDRYTTLFETLPNPVLHARTEDGEPVVRTVNPAFEETFGYDAATISGEPIQEYILPDDRTDAADRLNRRVLTEDEVETEVQRETTDGVRTFQLNVRAHDTEDETHEGYAVYTDITEQKQTERDLRRERDLVTELMETVPVGISVVGADGTTSFVNDQMESISGRSFEEIEGTQHDESQYDLVDEHGDPLESSETPFNRVVSQETTIRNQVLGTCRPSGERVWLSVTGAPQWNDDGELERAVFAFEDITEQRELEAKLAEILGRVSDAFFALDAEFRFTHVNGRAEELLQASKAELLGETVWEMYPEAAKTDKIRDAFHAAMDTQTPQSLELYYQALEFWLEARVYPSESGISVYFRDVTEQKEHEQTLGAQNERLEEFASVVSHDLRSPLTIADGQLRLALESCESEHLSRAVDAIDRCQALIEDLLTLARQGQAAIDVDSLEIANVTERSWQTTETMAATLETDTTRAIRADRSRLQQLFENLYRNAVEHGGDDVTVSVGAMADGFYVADTGPGVPESDREDVFEAGYSTNEDGTGFGLRIVEQIADAHGWEVAVTESEQGGARFEFTGVEFAGDESWPNTDS